MKFSFNFISLFLFILSNISSSYALILSQDLSNRMNISGNINLINNPKIGIVDFRNILKESMTMKKLGKEFLQFERRLNEKIKKQEKILRDKEFQLSSNKTKISKERYNKEKNNLNKEITNLQKFALAEKKDLNLSFQLIQKKLRDILASIIKTISKEKLQERCSAGWQRKSARHGRSGAGAGGCRPRRYPDHQREILEDHPARGAG